MPLSKRSQEGYFIVDHRAGDGIAPDEARKLGALPVGSGAMLECPTSTCSHCQFVVIMNPTRTRARPYCPKCDHYICDGCEVIRVASGGECKPFKQIADEVQEQALRATSSGLILPP